MKCLFYIALAVTASYTFAVDDTSVDPSLPGATVIELESIGSPDSTAPGNQLDASLPEQAVVKSIQIEEKPSQPVKVPATSPPDNHNAVYTVQLGAFKARERAFALYWDLSKVVSPLQVTAPLPKDKLYRVRYGSYPNREEASAAAEKLRKKGIECFIATLKTMEIIPLKLEKK